MSARVRLVMTNLDWSFISFFPATLSADNNFVALPREA